MSDVADLARAWGPLAAAPRLVAQRENAVYAVTFADGRRAALRLHRPGYRSRAEVMAELDWTAALARQGFPCPEPLALPGGAWLPATGPLCSVVRWMEGAAPTEAQTHTPEHAHALGALLARLHRLSDAVDLPAPPGPGWTIDTLLGDAPRLGRFWDSPALDARGRDLLTQGRAALRRVLPDMPGAQTGFVHGDPLRENLLAGSGGLCLIDFDDSGSGLQGYDLGSALIQTALEPGASERAAALSEGYGRPDLRPDLPAWCLLRALASCGWAVSRLPPHDPRIRHYAERAVALARDWLA